MPSGFVVADYAAHDLDVPASGGALPDKLYGREVMVFENGEDRTAYTRPRFLPPGIGGDDYAITIRLCWMTAATNVNNQSMRWFIALEAYNSQDLTGQSFGVERSVSDTPIADDDNDAPRPFRPRYTDVTFSKSDADGIVAGQLFRVRIARKDASEPDGFEFDTMAEPALLLGVLILQS